MNVSEFTELRYGLFVHFGLYSALGRGEWVMNREQIPPVEMERLARDFAPERFDAEALCRLAVEGGMKYIVFTTMHHEGFRMYPTRLSEFNAAQVCGRDFVREVADAARRNGLKLVLYHSLTNLHDAPDAADALEKPGAYDVFIRNTFARLKELAENYDFDIMWYDGWWPFNAVQWQAEEMNRMLRKIRPGLLFNGRNGLPGDCGTPEQHLTPPDPWRPWEACVTLNDHWGFFEGDENWKTPQEVIKMLLACNSRRGNLLLNVGPRGDGSVPEKSAEILRAVGRWLREGGEEAVSARDELKMSPGLPAPGERGDWDPSGRFTASGNTLYYVLMYPVPRLTVAGFLGRVLRVSSYGIGEIPFSWQEGKITVEIPGALRARLCPVLKFECDSPPGVYRTGGMRVPACSHPRYDPVPPDIRY